MWRIRELIVVLQSPTIGTSAKRCLPISAGVDIDVDDPGVRGERGGVAGDPVVEPCAECDQQVTALQGGDGGDGAVHAGHAVVQSVTVGNAPRAMWVVTDGDAGLLGEFTQFVRGVGFDHSAADVEHRAFGCGDQVGCGPELLVVGLRDDVVPR
ncbi:hypothetical protein RR21198_4620 [Rhodococcus rhodochrous ATCC 21198]|nr:hypothetical protein RR21198_4620 [Rhodococcus rhodochrous ATCC 21198]KDE10227.1 hypothetical protein N505_0127465 [Rhodococcus aetherivorans]